VRRRLDALARQRAHERRLHDAAHTDVGGHRGQARDVQPLFLARVVRAGDNECGGTIMGMPAL
jgi:hypothetical protein